MNRYAPLQLVVLFFTTLSLLTAVVVAEEQSLVDLSLEELMAIEVTSVSKKKEKLIDAAAAIYVISREDIIRSGLRSIPELLRLVPGLHVAQTNSSTWAVSSRGFNSIFANKLLVLIDGRSIYTPLFSGVNWDTQDTLLEDIERIEIIRGPGSTLWGANAVNGVINIITRHSQDTNGGLLIARGGNEEKGGGAFRFGNKLGENGNYRLYFKGFNRGASLNAAGSSGQDEWFQLRSGFRSDWQLPHDSELVVQGDVFYSKTNQLAGQALLDPPFFSSLKDKRELIGTNFLTRVTKNFSGTNIVTGQLYYDFNRRNTQLLDEDRHTIDADFRHRFNLSENHELSWGTNFRLTADQLKNSFAISLNPSSRSLVLASFFAQDHITILRDTFFLTFGSKFDYNNLTDFEFQPSARLLYKLSAKTSIWTAISRAVRTPSRAEDDVRINLATIPDPNTGLLNVPALIGNRSIKSEDLLALETGVKSEITRWASVDLTGFYFSYNDLTSFESTSPFNETTPAPAHIVIPTSAGNAGNADTFGIELTTTLRPCRFLRLVGNYTFFEMSTSLDAGSTDTQLTQTEGQNPEHQFSIQSYLDLPKNITLTALFFFVDSLSTFGTPSTYRLDSRIAWSPTTALEVSVIAQNITNGSHTEFGNDSFTGAVANLIQRSIFGEIRFNF